MGMRCLPELSHPQQTLPVIPWSILDTGTETAMATVDMGILSAEEIVTRVIMAAIRADMDIKHKRSTIIRQEMAPAIAGASASNSQNKEA